MQTTLGGLVLFVDIVFSYLYAVPLVYNRISQTDCQRWITSFIFSAQDYNWRNCFLNAPPGVNCSIKHANEAFIFLSLYVTPPKTDRKEIADQLQ